MLTIVFETHATSLDNEAGLASGWFDVGLSPRGEREATELGRRYRPAALAAVCCLDLRRATETVRIAFGASGVPIVHDPRLRECDYGDLARHPVTVIERERPGRITEPFPNGESYVQAAARMRTFLDDLRAAHPAGATLLVVGCRATQYGLEHWCNGVPLRDAVSAPWCWQPGWTYRLATAGLSG